MKDHYNVLGIKENAQESEIKKAYRSLSLKYHPDRNSSQEAKDKMTEINEAFEILGDSQSKQKYDHQRKFGNTGGGIPMNHAASEFQDINNIFNMMFAGGNTPFGNNFQTNANNSGGPNIRVFHNGRPANFNFHSNMQHIRKPSVIQKQVVISLEQCYNGCVVELNVSRTVEKNNESTIEEEDLYINIPKGINNKEIMTLHEKGNIIDSQLGDIKITVIVENNTPYIRQGLDVILKENLTLKDALCGFSLEFTYLNGKKFALNNTDNYTLIKPGYKKVIPNMGITRDGKTGSFIVHFEVEFPNTLDKTIREKLAEIL